MAAPSFVGNSTTTLLGASVGSSISVSSHASTAVGDLVVVTVFGYSLAGSSSTITAPAGWTKLSPSPRPANPGFAFDFVADQFLLISPTAGATSYSFTLGAGFASGTTANRAVFALSFTLTGIQTASLPFSAAVTIDSVSTGSSSYTPPSLNVTRNQSLAVSTRLMHAGSGGYFNTANGWTGQYVLNYGPIPTDGRVGSIVTDIDSSLTMPAWTSGTNEVISFGWAVHGFPDRLLAYGAQVGVPTGPSAAYGVY